MFHVKLQLFLISITYFITVAVCNDGWSELSTPWGVIKYQHQKEIDGEIHIHTLHLYYNKGPAAGCNVVKLDASTKAKVVELHNAKRRYVAKGLERRGDPGPQPRARNMLRLVYDKILEFLAEAWISQCIYDHDKFRNIAGYISVGQNLCEKASALPFEDPTYMERCLEKCYNEVRNMSKYAVAYYTSRKDAKTGHYAQMVYGATNRIGCAQAYYFDDSSKKYKLLVGCVYGNGVHEGKALYEEGEPCSSENEHCDDGLLITEEIGAKAAFSVGDTSFVNIPQWSRDIPHSTAKRHVLDYPGPAEGCSPREMTHADRERVVNIHNSRRRKVAKGLELRGNPGPQRKAANMQQLTYSNSLEQLALAWVSQCKPTSRPNRNIDKFNTIGHNIQLRIGPAPFGVLDWKDIIDHWYNQVEKSNGKTVVTSIISKYSSAKEYFQIAFSDVISVGCAHAVYLDTTDDSEPLFVRFIACYYAEGINNKATPLYKEGEPCSSVHGEYRYCDDGLISAEQLIGCTPHGMTRAEIGRVVKGHNYIRRRVAKGMVKAGWPGPQPPAARMMKMKYDGRLEVVANTSISHCQNSFDQSASKVGRFDAVSQNVVLESSSKPLQPINWEKIIKDWYSQVKNFNSKYVTSYTDDDSKAPTRSYAQIVKDTAHGIACAASTYVLPTAEEPYKRVVACNYGGGVTNGQLYQVGKPCSTGEKNCDDGLYIKTVKAKL